VFFQQQIGLFMAAGCILEPLPVGWSVFSWPEMSAQTLLDRGETMTQISVIVLAAGKGTRMKSPLPKVLHPVAGDPMISRVLAAVRGCGAEEIRVVVGYGEALLRQVLEPQGIVCCKQEEQKGTADAVRAADPSSLGEHILIMNGDHPLVTAKHLQEAYAHFVESQCDLMVLSAHLDQPGNFGRIVRYNDQIKAIVEVKDASEETKKIKEVNTGIYFVRRDILETYLPQIHPNNKQGEYYITDMVSLCIEAGEKVLARPSPPTVAFGVNTQKELALATKAIFREKCFQLMEEGVMVIDPENTYVEASVHVGPGSMLYPGCFIKGKTLISSFCVVEPNAFIQDSVIGQSTQIRAGSYLEKAKVGDQAIIGPYARLRPQTEIGPEARVGNFVEMKKVKFGAKSKANHLAYLGDTEVGEDTNIGCGVITCNYAADKKKYKTIIGSHVFIGSDSQMVAPVEIGDNAIVASGSTINKNVPEGALALGRSRQVNKEDYAKKFRKD
jgi:bifunctional UDP-N-acetylglucosamine pyrophosphorylase/glucosamine-1-phosphate N-acetyltransferase